MKQKKFYEAFDLLYMAVKEALYISQKEELYRMLFKDIYALSDDGLFDNDTIRKITSGNGTIHIRAMKHLCTCEGFEIFRKKIEEICLPGLSDQIGILSKLYEICKEPQNMPEEILQALGQCIGAEGDYQISRAIGAVLVCLNYSDYLENRGKGTFFDIGFMRLASENALPMHPKYITDMPDAAAEEFIGRQEELEKLSEEIVDRKGKLLVSAVGGLGKTELVKEFLQDLLKTDTGKSGIEVIAWIPYNGNDIRLSMKQAMHLHCDLEEVWNAVQEIVYDYGDRMLLVVDNIENTGNDRYLNKLAALQCRILVTSRQRSAMGFPEVMYLQPLKMEECRNLFYRHYSFEEYDNETLNDIIELTARLTIMIVFLAKVAYLEGMSLRALYRQLVEKGFKLSEEDVSCEHEKMQNDETIIHQMCILFSLVNYQEGDKQILTYISVIPNLQFDFSKAKKWFRIKRNSSLMKLFHMGMLEHVTKNRAHIYWMHSVIAAAVREQQKEKLYDLSRLFVGILSEELNTGPAFGREYEKAYLIPFSWSVADIMEEHWHEEEDMDFLTSLFHVCFACSNYSLCEKLINMVIAAQEDSDRFPYMDLAYSYRNKIDLLLQFDRAAEASEIFAKAEELFEKHNASEEERQIFNYQYGILYQIRGNYEKSRVYLAKCIEAAENSEEETREKDIATACSNMARMLVDSGDFFEAYDYIKRAIEVQGQDDDDADLMICYSTLAAICTELMNAGYRSAYIQEAQDSYHKVIEFREKKLGKHHADTAVAYHDYAYFLYVIEEYDEALKYNDMAYSIEEELFAEHSITRMRSLNTKALIIWEQGEYEKANDIFDYIIASSEKMSDDYLIDAADFAFNYARCLHDQGNDEKSKWAYRKCLAIWSETLESSNRKLAMAYQEYADCLFSEGKISEALENYLLADENISEDFYLKIDVLDSIAACHILNSQTEEGLAEFEELLRLLTKYGITDPEVKYQFCNNLLCILDAESEEEMMLRESLIDRIQEDEPVKEYVHTFLTDLEIKQNIQ